KAVASMNHVNIVRAYDVDKQTESGTDIHFLVMEYVEGKNLEQIVKDQGALDYITAVDAIRQAADGLAHAHQLGMVHRDVKPGNLLIDANGIVRLLDLGLARFFKSTEEESLTIKHDEKVLGTADYLAPEQAIDSHQVDSRADIYSLGCTLYFALTGHPPFTDGTLVQRLLAHQTKSPPSVRYERPDIDDSLLSILDKMMAKKTSDRFQTANDVSETLSRWLIQNAPSTWKQKHLMLVAALCGVDAIQNPNSQKNDSNGEVSRMTPSGPIATITETSQSATSDSDDKLIDPSSRSSNAVELKPRNKGAKSKGSKQKQRDSRPEVDSRRQLVSAASSVTETNLETGTSDTSNSSTQLSNRPVNLANGDLSTRPNSRGMTNTLSESTRTFMIAIAMLAVIIISVVGMYFLLVPPNAGNRVHLNEETEPVVGEHVVVPTQNSDT
ncbi:MAG: serine/threonine protein kinase, partial [Planctomycetes bacterium]|nr:serine/threonine protein kinase [Planctomycetota bacterium]